MYNAIFSPRGDGTTTLLDGQPTSVRFFIGPHNAESGISVENWTVNPDIIATETNKALAVTMNCAVCSGDSFQKRPITYIGSERRSSEAVFSIVPDRSLASTDGVGYVAFDVSGDGLVYDHIVVNVAVARPDEPQLPSLLEAQPPRSYEAPPPGERPVDVTITVKWDDTHQLALIFQPHDRNVARLLTDAYDGSGGFRSFQTNVSDTNELNRLKAEAYLQLRSVTDRFGEVNKAPAPDRDTILEAFWNAGVQIYDRLFITNDASLGSLVETLESLATPDKPLRVLVQTQNIYIPWQLIHPPGDRDASKFWGNKFEIVLAPIRERPGRLPGLLRTRTLGTSADPIVLLRYRREAPLQVNQRDTASELSEELVRWFASAVAGPNFADVTGKGEFIQRLRARRSDVELIVSFTHGSSGTHFRRGSGGTLIREEEADGPRLMLSGLTPLPPDRMLKPSDLNLLRLSFHRREWPVLSREPIVLMNACETGTPGVTPVTSFDFPPAWLDLGARAVLATEAPVEAEGAYLFGQGVLDRLMAGDDLLDAVHRRRQELMRVGNPIGLLYTYYGNPSVSLLR